MRQYEELYNAHNDLNAAKQRVQEFEATVQQLLVRCIPDVEPVTKRKYVRRRKFGKWSAYKKMKFALKCKARWARMSKEERENRVQRMLMARRINKKG